MKNAALATALVFATAAAPATAGSLADPIVPPAIIVQESTSSVDDDLLAPALFVIFVGAALLATPTALSDARLKTDITRAGTADNGLPLYTFRYIGQSQLWEGVMAQDVLTHTPEAVVDLGGYYGVNYEMLGLEMRAVD